MLPVPTIDRTASVLPSPSEDDTRSAPSGAAATLPDPQLDGLLGGADVGAAIAALVMTSAKENQKASRTARDAAYGAMEAAQSVQLDQMREAASAKERGGLLMGGATIVEAGCSAVQAARAADAAELGSEASNARSAIAARTAQGEETPEATDEAMHLERGAASASAQASYVAATGKGLEGTGKAFESFEDFDAASHEASTKAAEMAAQTEKRVAEEHDDDVKDARDTLHKALELLKEYEAAKNDATRAAFLRA